MDSSLGVLARKLRMVGIDTQVATNVAVRGARGALWWEAQPRGCVLYGPSAARKAAPAAWTGSLRLRALSNVPSRRASSTLAAGHGFGKEAHETVSWEKAARRPAVSSRSSTLPSAHDNPVRNGGGVMKERVFQWAAHTKSMQSAAIKQAFVGQEVVSQPHEGSGPTACRIWCCPTETSTNTPPALQNSTKSSTKTCTKRPNETATPVIVNRRSLPLAVSPKVTRQPAKTAPPWLAVYICVCVYVCVCARRAESFDSSNQTTQLLPTTRCKPLPLRNTATSFCESACGVSGASCCPPPS